MNPVITLLLGIAVVALLYFIFVPNGGVLQLWRKIKKQSERELVEDALKFLYNSEYDGIQYSEDSLCNALTISVDQKNKLLSRLNELNLIKQGNGKILLSAEGNSYALRIIRVHRLWEKYLADKTSVAETEWHNLAETKEHELGSEDANKLAAELGNPLHDPHGDPIPNEFGELPAKQGIKLTELDEGKFGVVVHVEDEPKEVFAQLSAIGLFPGKQIHILKKNKDRIIFEANENECVLAAELTDNISLIPIREKEEIIESFLTLSNLKQGESAFVVGLSNALRGLQRRRMLDFGIVPGAKITAQLKSLSGDPTAYEIRGTTIALRKNQSDHIYIKTA